LDQTARTVQLNGRLLRGKDENPICYLLSCVDSGAMNELKTSLDVKYHYGDLIGKSPRMQELFAQIRVLVNTNVPLLIQGEAGTGKALLAETIHQTGSRSQGPFITLDCSALQEAALTEELFGSAESSEGALESGTVGCLGRAHTGTLLLETFTSMSHSLQLRLARFLQSGAYEPGNTRQPMHVDVRIIATTPLTARLEMAAGRLRQDLFFQISSLMIQMPPLRERQEDLLPLVDQILPRIAAKVGLPGAELSAASLFALRNYDWPGNVQELQYAIQYAMLRAQGKPIGVEHLPSTIAAAYTLGANGAKRVGRARKLTQDAVRLAMQQARDNKAKAAQILGVSRATLYRYLEEEFL
jgi:DNA-binding NtrC family response regulator